MKRWLLLLIPFALGLCVTEPAFAQSGSLYSNTAYRYTPAGIFPASGASIQICTYSATGQPCSPTVTVYSDAGLSLPVANPLAACTVSPQVGCIDGFGNFSFYAAQGAYTYTVTGSGITSYGPITFGLSCVAGVSCVTTGGSNAFTGNNTHSGTETFTNRLSTGNLNDILIVDGVQYASIAAAVAAASSNTRIILIPSTYAGTECPASVVNNLTFWDFRGGSNICVQNSISLNSTSVGGLVSMLRGVHTTTSVTPNSGTSGYFQNFITNATVTGAGVVDGGSFEADFTGTLSGTVSVVQGGEHAVLITSTGGGVTTAVGAVGYVKFAAPATTPVTSVYGVWGFGCAGTPGALVQNCYGGYFPKQGSSGTVRNYAIGGEGPMLAVHDGNLAGWDFEDTTHVVHHTIFVDSSNTTQLQAVGTNGILFKDSAGNQQLSLTSTGLKVNTVITPNAAGGAAAGSAPLPFSGVFVGGGANLSAQLTGTYTANRTQNTPDASGTVLISGNGDGTHSIVNQTKRVAGCATAAPVNSTCDTTVTWTTPFADANYTATCTGDVATSGVPIVQGHSISAAKTASAITVRTLAITAVAAQFTAIDCIAIHD